MKEIGKKPEEVSILNYRDWPLFQAIKQEPKFLQVFEDIFGDFGGIFENLFGGGGSTRRRSGETWSTAPCLGTTTEKLSRTRPRSLWSHRSRTGTLPPIPRSLNFAVTGAASGPRLKRPTAIVPSDSGRAHTSVHPSLDLRLAARPWAGVWPGWWWHWRR